LIRRIGATLLILFILVFQIDQQKKEAQAIVPVVIGAAEAIAYIATTMVAAHAVGTFVKNVDGTWSGTLYEKASEIYGNMQSNMQNDLRFALGVASVAGYMATSKVSGLWDFLHGKFFESDSMVPIISSITDPASFFGESGGYYCYVYSYYNSSTDYGFKMSKGLPGSFNTFITMRTVAAGGAIIWNNVNWGTTNPDQVALITAWMLEHRDYWTSHVTSWNEQTMYSVCGYGKAPSSTIYTNGTLTSVNDGTQETPIAIPADATQLNNATVTSQLTTTGGTVTTPVPDSTALETGANQQADLVAAAAAASAAAIAAALAAGYSQAAAEAAGVAASNAIYAGQSAAAAAAAGAAAALSSTGALTTDIANTAEGDVLDFSKLKFAATLFTNKFPFSLPWDLKNMVTSFGAGSTAAPQIPIGIGNISDNIDMSRFDSLAAAVRVLELFAFGVGLLFGTRKLLGGAS